MTISKLRYRPFRSHTIKLRKLKKKMNEKRIARSSSINMEDKHHSLLGIFFIMLGSFSFSVMFLFVKFMKDVNTFTLVFYRAVIEIAIAVVELKRKNEPLLGPPDRKIRFYLFVRASTGAIAVCAFFMAFSSCHFQTLSRCNLLPPPFRQPLRYVWSENNGNSWILLDRSFVYWA